MIFSAVSLSTGKTAVRTFKTLTSFLDLSSQANLGTQGRFVATTPQTFGLFVGLLAVHGTLNVSSATPLRSTRPCADLARSQQSFGTRILAKVTQTFVFVNLGTAFAIIIALLITTKDKHNASYTFTHSENGSGWSSQGLTFLLGLLSVQWTMTDYDATAHISEEVKKASIAAPVAIFVAVIGTGAVGWVYNIVYVICSGDFAQYDGSVYAPALVRFRRRRFPLRSPNSRMLS